MQQTVPPQPTATSSPSTIDSSSTTAVSSTGSDDHVHHKFPSINPTVIHNRKWSEALVNYRSAWELRKDEIAQQIDNLKMNRSPLLSNKSLSSPVFCFERMAMSITTVLPVVETDFPFNNKINVTKQGIEIDIKNMPKELQSDLSVRKIKFHIGGQHENEFDPDYLIYNDVILQVERTPELLQLNEQEQIPSSIIGYPREDFEPINYHTSTLVSIKNNNDGDENDLSTFKIITIGNEGYRNGIDREFNSNRDDYECPVYSLDVLTFRMQRIQTSSSSSSSSSFSSKENQSPGLISGQRAKYIEEEDMIYVGSEKVLELLLPNILFNDGKNHQSNEKNSNDDDNSEVRTPRWAKRKELKTSNFVKRRVIENDTIEVEDSVYYTLCVKTWQWTKHCYSEPSARSSSSSSSSVPISVVTHDDSDGEVKYLRKRGADVSLEQLSPVGKARTATT